MLLLAQCSDDGEPLVATLGRKVPGGTTIHSGGVEQRGSNLCVGAVMHLSRQPSSLTVDDKAHAVFAPELFREIAELATRFLAIAG